MADDDGFDMAETALSVQRVGPLLLHLMVEGNWTAKHRLVREHEDDLLDPMVFRMAMVFIAEMDTGDKLKPLLRYHWTLINRCIEVGIDAAFADAALQQEFQNLSSAMSEE